MWGFRKKDKSKADQAAREAGAVTEPAPQVEPESALIARGSAEGDPVLVDQDRAREALDERKQGLFDRFRARPAVQPQLERPVSKPQPKVEPAPEVPPSPVVSPEAAAEVKPPPEPQAKPKPLPKAVEPAQPKPAPTPVEKPAPKAPPAEPAPPTKPAPVAEPELVAPKESLFARLRAGLSRTGSGLTEGLATLFMGKKTIDDELMEELETRLLMADVGVEATQRILDGVTQTLKRKELNDTEALVQALHENMVAILEPCSKPLQIDQSKQPFVLLVVGVNGVGKTTTIGKLARRFQGEGRSVILAAGDTFRAAAVEQLKVWGERSKIPVVAQHTGADSASVVFDALQAAKSRKQDVMIADTAGRLHTQENLMEELKKVKRVLGKLDAEAPHETLLVLDASNGQNALSQAKHFHEAVKVDGVVLTKLDGTAKGGVIFAIAEQLKLPIRFIGIGEQLEDLRPFDAQEFVKALLSEDGER